MTTPRQSGSFVELPDEIEGDFDVYVNGIVQVYEIDYRIDGRTIVFSRRLTPEVQMTTWQWVRAVLGIAGTYAKHDRIDISYDRDGRKLVATGLLPRNER